jgi:hypothetical protein
MFAATLRNPEAAAKTCRVSCKASCPWAKGESSNAAENENFSALAPVFQTRNASRLGAVLRVLQLAPRWARDARF